MLAETPIPTWRNDALAIIERLFADTAPAHWNDLLDLRTAIVSGTNWNRTLDLFLACRERLESDNYLPFYRLRRLLSTSLRLEVKSKTGTRHPLAAHHLRHRSLRDLEAALRRDTFEHDLAYSEEAPLTVQVIEAR
jgi:hypothetical protein